MEKISLLKTKIINCLQSSKMPTAQSNSILEQLFKQSGKTRSQFVEDMKQLVRDLNKNVNANILNIISFDKHLKNKTVTYKVSGTVFSNDWNSTKTKIVDGLVDAQSENEAQQLFFESWQYDSRWHSVEANDFSAIELPYNFSQSKRYNDKSYQKYLTSKAKQKAAV